MRTSTSCRLSRTLAPLATSLRIRPGCMLLRCSSVQARNLQPALIRLSSTKPPGETHIKRLTLFKIPKEEDIDRVLRQYEVLKKSAVKDGKPYITSSTSRRVLNTDSPLSEGFTLLSQSLFKDKESHDFYNQHCPAHKELKKVTAVVSTGKMTIVTEGEWPEPRL